MAIDEKADICISCGKLFRGLLPPAATQTIFNFTEALCWLSLWLTAWSSKSGLIINNEVLLHPLSSLHVIRDAFSLTIKMMLIQSTL